MRFYFAKLALLELFWLIRTVGGLRAAGPCKPCKSCIPKRASTNAKNQHNFRGDPTVAVCCSDDGALTSLQGRVN